MKMGQVVFHVEGATRLRTEACLGEELVSSFNQHIA